MSGIFKLDDLLRDEPVPTQAFRLDDLLAPDEPAAREVRPQPVPPVRESVAPSPRPVVRGGPGGEVSIRARGVPREPIIQPTVAAALDPNAPPERPGRPLTLAETAVRMGIAAFDPLARRREQIEEDILAAAPPEALSRPVLRVPGLRPGAPPAGELTGADIIAGASAAGTVTKEALLLKGLGAAAGVAGEVVTAGGRRVLPRAAAEAVERLAGSSTAASRGVRGVQSAARGAVEATAFGVMREGIERGEVDEETLAEALKYAPWGAGLGAVLGAATALRISTARAVTHPIERLRRETDPFRALGLDQATATEADIARAVRQKGSIWHPDINSAPEAGETMAAYTAAAQRARDILRGGTGRARPAPAERPAEAQPAAAGQPRAAPAPQRPAARPAAPPAPERPIPQAPGEPIAPQVPGARPAPVPSAPGAQAPIVPLEPVARGPERRQATAPVEVERRLTPDRRTMEAIARSTAETRARNEILERELAEAQAERAKPPELGAVLTVSHKTPRDVAHATAVLKSEAGRRGRPLTDYEGRRLRFGDAEYQMREGQLEPAEMRVSRATPTEPVGATPGDRAGRSAAPAGVSGSRSGETPTGEPRIVDRVAGGAVPAEGRPQRRTEPGPSPVAPPSVGAPSATPAYTPRGTERSTDVTAARAAGGIESISARPEYGPGEEMGQPPVRRAPPERSLRITLGAHGARTAEFGAALEKELFSAVGRSRRGMRDEPAIRVDWEQLRALVGRGLGREVSALEIGGMARDYREAVMVGAREATEGDVFQAPSLQSVLRPAQAPAAEPAAPTIPGAPDPFQAYREKHGIERPATAPVEPVSAAPVALTAEVAEPPQAPAVEGRARAQEARPAPGDEVVSPGPGGVGELRGKVYRNKKGEVRVRVYEQEGVAKRAPDQVDLTEDWQVRGAALPTGTEVTPIGEAPAARQAEQLKAIRQAEGARREMGPALEREAREGRAMLMGQMAAEAAERGGVVDDVAAHRAGLTPAEIGTVKADAAERAAALPEAASALPGKPSKRVRTIPTAEIHRDPGRFQYKQLGSEGVSGELRDVTKWDSAAATVIAVWRDPADRKVYVVNGHNRHDLAERLGVEEMDVQFLNEAPYSAQNATEARAFGAFLNIQEGRGNPTDAAKFMRDMNVGLSELDDRGVSLRGDVARKAVALARLAPDIFDLVARAEIPERWGVAIAEVLEDPALQREALKAIRNARLSEAEIREVARQVKEAGTEAVTQETLFGTETERHGLFVQRAQVAAALKRKLATDRRLFGFVSKEGRAEELGRAGTTKIDVEAAQNLAEQSATAEEIFDRLYTRSGPVAEVVSEGARRLAHGEPVAAIARDLYPRIGAAVEAELARPDVAPAAGSTAGGRVPAGAGERGADRPGEAGEVSEGAEDRVADSTDPAQSALLEERAPYRTPDTMSEAIALSSPSGKMSARARAAAAERLRVALFGPEGLQRELPKQPTEAEALLRQAAELRDLAARGMKPRAHINKAEELERRAAEWLMANRVREEKAPYGGAETPDNSAKRVARQGHLDSVTAKRMGFTAEDQKQINALITSLMGARPVLDLKSIQARKARLAGADVVVASGQHAKSYAGQVGRVIDPEQIVAELEPERQDSMRRMLRRELAGAPEMVLVRFRQNVEPFISVYDLRVVGEGTSVRETVRQDDLFGGPSRTIGETEADIEARQRGLFDEQEKAALGRKLTTPEEIARVRREGEEPLGARPMEMFGAEVVDPAVAKRLERVLMNYENAIRKEKKGPGLAATQRNIRQAVQEFRDAGVSEHPYLKRLAQLAGEGTAVREVGPVYHGSQYRFDRFSSEKIGTGEGAQAYGYGLYFAARRGTAEFYEKSTRRFGQPSWLYKGDPVSSASLLADALDYVRQNEGESTAAALQRTAKELREHAQFWLRELMPGPLHETAKLYIHTAETLERLDPKDLSRPSGVYEVSLEVADDELLDWDKSLSQQSEKVRSRFLGLFDDETRDAIVRNDPMGGALYQNVLPQIRDTGPVDPQRMSERLNALGIRGIRYLDQGSRAVAQWRVETFTSTGDSRGAAGFDTQAEADAVAKHAEQSGWTVKVAPPERPTYNYVIFDDSAIKITGVSEPHAKRVFGSEKATKEAVRLSLSANRVPTLDDQLQVMRNVPQTSVEYVGKRLASADDVGALMQPIRSPKAETFVFQLLNDADEIVGEQVWTSGAVDRVEFEGRMPQVFSHLTRQAERLGATKLVLVHNHPGGDPSPSKEDLGVTAAVLRMLRWGLRRPRSAEGKMQFGGQSPLRFERHFIINHDTVAEILIPAQAIDAPEVAVARAMVSLQSKLTKLKPESQGVDWTSHKKYQVLKPSDVLAISGMPAANKGHVLYRDNRGRVAAVVPHHVSAFDHMETWLEAEAKSIGATSAVIVVDAAAPDGYVAVVGHARRFNARNPSASIVDVQGARAGEQRRAISAAEAGLINPEDDYTPGLRRVREPTPPYEAGRPGTGPVSRAPAVTPLAERQRDWDALAKQFGEQETLQQLGPRPEAEAPERTVSLKKEEGAEIRERLGLDALPSPTRQSFQALWDEALAGKLEEQATLIAQEANAAKRPLTGVEHAAAVQRYLTLERQLTESRATLADAAQAGNDVIVQREGLRSQQILHEIDALTRATDRAGTEAGRALGVRRLRANVDSFTLATGLQIARARKGAPLSSTEIAQIERLTEEVAQLQQQNGKLEEQNRMLADQRDKALAAQVAQIMERRARVSKESALPKIRTERKKLLDDLMALGLRLNDITGVSAEGVYLIGRLAVNHIQEAAATAGEKVTLTRIVGAVLADLNNPAIEARDIYEALNARNPRQQRQQRTELERQVRELKTEARLLTEIEKAEAGIFAPKRTRPEQVVEIRTLQKRLTQLRSRAYRAGLLPEALERAVATINSLQDQLSNHYRTLKREREAPVTSPELDAMRATIRGLRQEMRVEDTLADIEEQLRTGDLRPPERREPTYTSPQLERNQIALQRARRKWREAIERMAPMTVRRVVAETTGFLRTTKAMADMSGTLRQGLWLSARRPVMATKAFGKSFKAFFDQNTADQIENAIRQHPNQLARDKAGLVLTEIGGKLSDREEYFASSFAERIPVFGAVVRASERSMATTLNLIRVGAFDQFLAQFPNATTEEFQEWANWVNVASGRGDLGKAEAVATEMSLFFFAPRFAVSRIQTPFMLMKHWQSPRVRKEIAKDYAAVVGLGLTMLGLAALAGLAVGLDPREPDFGKIRIGNTRIDLWAGVQQPVRLLARIALGLTDRLGLTGEHLTETEKDVDPLELAGRFAAFKLAPSFTVPLELYRGETAVGEERQAWETLARVTVPLILDDVYDAYRIEGAGGAAIVAPGVFLGVGMQTYEDSESAVRRVARKLLSQGDTTEAVARMREWNAANPTKDPIRSLGVGDQAVEVSPRNPPPRRPPGAPRRPQPMRPGR